MRFFFRLNHSPMRILHLCSKNTNKREENGFKANNTNVVFMFLNTEFKKNSYKYFFNNSMFSMEKEDGVY